jgi:glutamate/tyrosine decarboxylase-like PLP-dependent enzyme
MEIPEKGWDADRVLETLRSYQAHDLDGRGGRVFAYGYRPLERLEATIQSAYVEFMGENALDPIAFPSLARIERDVVRMIAGLLRGDDRVVGNCTSGGTESILLAVKTARDWARRRRPEIREPEMVLPRSAHCAFHKAAQYFNVRPVAVAIDPQTMRADVDAVRRAVSANTILLVASAPQYAHGVVDPVEEIAAFARERGLWLHVDACVGGIQLSIQREMGDARIPDFDFSVPGVSSISADMHKFGYSPKGASVVLYRDKSLRRPQIFSSIASATYALVNPTILSTKSGGPLAGAWAALAHIGREGYREMLREVMRATERMIEGIQASGDLYVLGRPHTSLFAIASDRLNVFELADEMQSRGWYLQPQFSTECSPMNLHVTVNYGNVPVVDEFLSDLHASLDVLRARKPIDVEEVRGQVQALLASTPPEGLYQAFAAAAGFADGRLPQKMALVNTFLECLPRDVGAEFLGDFVNDMYV